MAPEDTRPPPSAVTLPAGIGATDHPPAKAAAAALVLGALGVVFGDIGTSPLYTLREVFTPGSGMTPTPRHVLGVLSILFWAVTLTVTVKYVTLIMRADNKGEGGVLALATLATQGLNGRGRKIRRWITLFAVIGTGAVLRRRHHHAGDDGDERGRGPRGVAPGSSTTSCRCRSDPGRLFVLQSRGTADVGRCSGRSCWCGSSCWACWRLADRQASRRAGWRSTRCTAST
jgi:KUP system potassium uptake protein